MDKNICLLFCLGFLGLALLYILYLTFKLYRIREQLSFIQDALADLKEGNLNRRVLTRKNDLTRQICYDINEIALSSQARLIQQKQAQEAYKRLMTSLSHDVKTPLASLVGYLEAVQKGLVSGEEKEEYLQVAWEKACRLKEFVASLFEWVKLDAKEQTFHFEIFDINELSRSIFADWIPILESSGLEYEIEIPEQECAVFLDPNAYTRILNNLLQNVIIHSRADHIQCSVTGEGKQVRVIVTDNGQGIAPEDLPHIFERMYQCDRSRLAKGNGLGLSIAQELVRAHKGRITAESALRSGTTVTVLLPRAL